MKPGVVIFNTSCLNDTILSNENIYKIDLHVFFNEDEFFGDAQGIVDAYAQNNILPSTSQPSTQEIIDKLQEVCQKHDEVIIVCPSAHLSGTLNNTRLAIESIDNGRIHMVHARSFTLSEFGVINLILDAIENKEEVISIVDRANEYAKHFETFILPGSLDYMRHGGRVNTTQLLVGKMMTLKILVRHIEPSAVVYKKLRGLKSVISQLDEEMNKGFSEAYYTSFNKPEEDKIYQELAKLTNKRGVELIHCGLPSPIVTCQFGDNTFGIAFKLDAISEEFEVV